MKCSYQSGYKFDQTNLELKVVVNWRRSVPKQGECAFLVRFNPGSQVVQIHKGTRDGQQSHFLPEETFSEDEHKVCVVLK